MSIFSAMSTAVSGLTAQSASFTNISNNISNSQTVGYKGTDTSFADYLTSTAATQNNSGSVVASSQAQNNVQGTITSSSNALALAVSGNGFFNVSEQAGTSNTQSTTFQTTQYYTRNGDFSENAQGYLVNTSGEYLDGYMVDGGTGQLGSTLQPINVSKVAFKPVATGSVTYDSTLPQTQSGTTSSAVTVYDASGSGHQLDLSWQQSSTNSDQWTLTATPADSTGSAATATVSFNSDGSIASVSQNGATTSGIGSAASLNVGAVFGGTSQPITLNIGTIGSTSGTTMSTSSTGSYSVSSLSQDGVATANYTGIAMQSNGDVMATFDNGDSQLVAHIPLSTFANADGLKGQDGQAYTATAASGRAVTQDAGVGSAGTLETSSVEASNVDIDTDLTKLITAQQAYSANAKVVTTADQMLQTALSMKQ